MNFTLLYSSLLRHRKQKPDREPQQAEIYGTPRLSLKKTKTTWEQGRKSVHVYLKLDSDPELSMNCA